MPMKLCARLLVALTALLGLACLLLREAGTARAQEPRPAPASPELLEGLLRETGWQYVQEQTGIFRIPMEEGPDVWVHISGEYVCTRAIVGDLPAAEELTTKPLLDLLAANYSIYRGKFSVDEERTVWFEINTPRRMFDGTELDTNILYVAQAAAQHGILPRKAPG